MPLSRVLRYDIGKYEIRVLQEDNDKGFNRFGGYLWDVQEVVKVTEWVSSEFILHKGNEGSDWIEQRPVCVG